MVREAVRSDGHGVSGATQHPMRTYGSTGDYVNFQGAGQKPLG